MIRNSVADAAKILRDHVSQYLWNLAHKEGAPRPRRIGLAISGGVDSMALATLCKQSQPDFAFTGFIVDHGVRSNSSDEAGKVAEELHRVGIEPQVLRLDWSTHGDPRYLTNFEAVARRLRYRAIGRACHGSDIRSLLVGHHADDQAETVLSRIVSKYTGVGLAGIQAEGAIPECAGIYGVDGSGSMDPHLHREGQDHQMVSGRILIEQGGVNICRPLLRFTKNQLIEVCQQENVKWFEDPTNADRKLTIRNTLRHLQQSYMLPVALQRTRLCDLAFAAQARNAFVNNAVEQIFQDMDIGLDLRLGTATFTIRHDTIQALDESARPFKVSVHHIKSALLRKLMYLLTSRSISLQDLHRAVYLIFSTEPRASPMQCGNINIQFMEEYRSGKKVSLCRQNPIRSDVLTKTPLVVDFHDKHDSDPTTGWLLWDDRYWLRLTNSRSEAPLDKTCMFVRFLTPDMLSALRKTLDTEQARLLDRKLQAAKHQRVQWTLPAIVANGGERETVVFLPSLHWENPAYRRWYIQKSGNCTFPFHSHIRYKSVDFKMSETHQIIS